MSFGGKLKSKKRFIFISILVLPWISALSGCALFMPREIRLAEERMTKEAQKLESESPSHSRISEWSGARVHLMEVKSDPSKPLIFFVHGSPGSWKGWSEYLNDPDLRAKANLIAVDRPGFGESNPGHAEKSLQKQADLFGSLLGQLPSSQKVILVGHSFGGPVVARMAMDYPNQVNHLVILAGSIDPNLEKTQWYQYPADWWAFRWLVPSALVVCNQEIMALKPYLSEMLPLWSKITHGVTVIQGTDDDLVPAANADFAEKVLVNAKPLKVIRLEKMNHFIPWSQFALVKKEILDVVASMNQK